MEYRRLGKTGLEVTPLVLTAGGVRGVNPKGPKLTADEVERAYHEHGVNSFFANTLFPEVAEGIRRLIRAGHREDLEGRRRVLGDDTDKPGLRAAGFDLARVCPQRTRETPF